MKGQSWKRVFYGIWTGQALSLVTSSVVQYAIIWDLTAATQSAMVLSAAAIAGLLPMALFSPFIGSFIDRYNRKKIMIAADSAIALVALFLAALGANGLLTVPVILAALFLRSVGSSIHEPCLQAVTPLLVPENELARCGGYTASLQSVSLILSPALAAVLVPVTPLYWLLLLDVFGAVCGILPLLPAKIPHVKPEGGRLRIFSDTLYGLSALRQNKGICHLVLIIGLFSLVYVPTSSLYPLLCMSWFEGTALHAGIAETAFSAGMLFGGLALGVWGGTKDKIKTMLPSLFFIGVVTLLMGRLPRDGFVIFAFLALATGFAAPFFSSLFMAMIQQQIAPQVLGRVIGVSSSIMALACPAGLALSGLFAQKIGLPNWFVITGAVTILCGVLCLADPAIRNADRK